MVGTAAKLWYGVAALALVATPVYAFASGEEWFGGFILFSLAVAALLLGVLASAVRDGDIDADDPAAGLAPVRRALPAPWPALGAVGAGLVAIGLAGGGALLYVGLGLLGAVLAETMVSSWAERRTADHALNQALRNRIMFPLEIPVLAVVGVAVVVLPFSRVLLAIPKEAATAIAIVLATVILLVSALVTSRPKISSSVLTGLLALGALVVIGAGIASLVEGEREFEHPATENAEDPGSDESNNPSDDEGGENQSDSGADPSHENP